MKKMKKVKLILAIIVLILMIVSTIYLIPIMKNLSTTEGQLQFKQKINDTGIIGLLILFMLDVAQIFLVILPGEPLEVLAGMCYGSIWGSIFIFATVAITTMAIFLLVRKFGKNFIYEFFYKEKIDKIENSKFFANPKKIEIILIILFAIPGTPKDLLVYLGGLFPIKPIKFILISTFARFPSVISSTIAGDNLSIGKWQFSLIVYGITFVLTAVMIFIINKFDKEKVTKDALEAIK